MYSQQIQPYKAVNAMILQDVGPSSLVDGINVSEEPTTLYKVHPRQLLNTTATGHNRTRNSLSGSSGVKCSAALSGVSRNYRRRRHVLC
jgi:hypothetical protein